MSLQLDQITITLDGTALFQKLDLVVQEGQVATLMGPSGIGKSTLLAAISGVLPPAFDCRGDIVLAGKSLLGVPVSQRAVGILFQDDLLFPHLDVFHNLAFALPANTAKSEKKQRIQAALQSAGLAEFSQRDIATLSGGQRARISLLRTLLAEPRLLLLDEPFAKLDLARRNQFRAFVFERIVAMNIPALLVTHDPADQADRGFLVELEKHHA